MEPHDFAISIFLLVLALISSTSASPVSVHSVSHILVSRGIESPSNDELLHNTIAFGIAAMVAYVLRMINRGFVLKKLHAEDHIMTVTMFFYIALMVLINVSARYGTNLYPPEQEASILANPVDIQNRILGSKIVIALEQCMIASTWGVKLCIWTFIMRVFRNLPQYQRLMWYLLAYIILGFVVIEITYYGVFCRPFRQYWAVPVRDIQCATYQHYSILQMCFNITSDLGLIIMPFPLVRKVRIPTRNKFALFGVFLMAGFTILAAIMNKVYNFASPMTTVYQLWYIREASVAVCVGNIICIWQLLQKMFKFRTFGNKSAEIRDEPAMPQFIRSGNPLRRAWNYLTTHDSQTRYQTNGTVPVYSVVTSEAQAETAHSDEKKEKPEEKGGRVTTRSYMMTLNRDGEGDARPALAFRDQNHIE